MDSDAPIATVDAPVAPTAPVDEAAVMPATPVVGEEAAPVEASTSGATEGAVQGEGGLGAITALLAPSAEETTAPTAPVSQPPACLVNLFKLFSAGDPVTPHSLLEFSAANQPALQTVVPSKTCSKRLLALMPKAARGDIASGVVTALLSVLSPLCTNPASLRNLIQEGLGRSVNEVGGGVQGTCWGLWWRKCGHATALPAAHCCGRRTLPPPCPLPQPPYHSPNLGSTPTCVFT